ncbi:MAG TPA: hypothetical protein VIH21_02705 [Dehalococcoidia bacterium]
MPSVLSLDGPVPVSGGCSPPAPTPPPGDVAVGAGAVADGAAVLDGSGVDVSVGVLVFGRLVLVAVHSCSCCALNS